ncbi:methyl farnesoate epoxidase-like isoform X2 [Cimex lectularius]|nr:methyl farnesoate epoxidase-like isoform X2 [Cimex lectularius]XP_024085188.1 methyl farnesoate epoxidase-like isoform X2 [Cimex lectularius]
MYGPITGIRLGRDRLVIATDNKTVREILTRDEFDARPDGFFFRMRSFGQRFGIVFVDGPFFNEQKKFCMKHLKSFGLNRSIMEDRITVETTELIAAIKSSSNRPITVPNILGVSVVNSLWSMVAGERFKVGDSRPLELLNFISLGFRLQDMSGGLLNQMPFLRFIAPELSSFNKVRLVLNTLTKFLQNLINEHRKTVSSYENRDLIDAYLNEIDKNRDGFTEQQLVVLLLDLFLAGAETTQSTLGYAILMLLHFPQIQKILQDEIDTVCGSNVPEVQHRSKLTYFEAFFMELQRYTNVTPTTVSHRATKDTDVLGYSIPQDTVILANLYSLHMDKEHWGDPEIFRPERFLDEKKCIINDEWFLPFGIGKRRCLGEIYAKMSLFLFLSSILYHFTVTPVPGEPVPTIKGLDGATICPRPFQCMFVSRR